MRTQPRPATAPQSTTLDLVIVGAVVLLIALLAIPSFEPLTSSGTILMTADATQSGPRSLAPVE